MHLRVHTLENAVIGEARFHRKEPEPTVSCWCQALYKEPLSHGKHKLTSQEAPEFSVDMRGLANNKVLSFCTYKPYIKRLTLSREKVLVFVDFKSNYQQLSSAGRAEVSYLN